MSPTDSAKTRFSIPIAKPTPTMDAVALVEQAFSSGWVSMGPLTQQFEQAICEYTGARFGVAVNSCTSAIHISMLIHGIGAGDEVLCPSYSFIASANGLRHAGAEPRFVDIDPATLNIDPVKTEEYIAAHYVADASGALKNKQTGRTLKGIQIVHQIGIPADIDTFAAIAKKHNLVLVEDNACGLGSTYKGQQLGSSGFTNSLSFHPRKVITSGEGGMLLTNDETLAEKARVYRAHGMSISDFARHNAKATTFETYEVVGYNYRLTDIQAALGIQQMVHLPEFLQRRAEIAALYNNVFSLIDELSIITSPEYVTHWNYQSYPLRIVGVTKDHARALRDQFMEELQAYGVTTRRGIPPIHKEPVYDEGLTLPETEAVSDSSLMLPIFPLMTDAEAAYVTECVKSVTRKVLVKASV